MVSKFSFNYPINTVYMVSQIFSIRKHSGWQCAQSRMCIFFYLNDGRLQTVYFTRLRQTGFNTRAAIGFLNNFLLNSDWLKASQSLNPTQTSLLLRVRELSELKRKWFEKHLLLFFGPDFPQVKYPIGYIREHMQTTVNTKPLKNIYY